MKRLFLAILCGLLMAGSAVAGDRVIGNLEVTGDVKVGTATLVQLVADNATDETATIQAALNTYNHVMLVPKPGSAKVALISSALVISSNQNLELAHDLLIRFKAGSSGNMLQNRAVMTSNRALSDAAISSTTNTTTLTSATAAFNSSDVGRSIIVAGAGYSGDPLVALVSSVTNSTTAVLSVAAQTTVSGAALTIYDRDSNIRISGGAWDRGGALGTGNGLCSIMLRRIDRLQLDNIRSLSTDGKFGFNVGDVTDVTAQSLYFNTSSDGIHFEGPSKQITVRGVTGKTGDDSVAFTSREYPEQRDVCGNIEDILIENVDTISLKSAVKILSGPGTYVKNVTVRTIRGSGVVAFNYFDDPTVGTGPLHNLLVEDIKYLPSGGAPVTISGTGGGNAIVRNVMDIWPDTSNRVLVLLGGTWDGVLVDGLSYDHAGVTSTNKQWVKVGSNTTIGKLTIKNASATNLGSSLLLQFDGTVNRLIGSNLQTDFAEAMEARLMLFNSGSVIGSAQFSNVQQYQGLSILDTASGSTIGPVQMSNGWAKGCRRFSNVYGALDLTLSNFALDNPTLAAFYVVAPLTIRGSGINRVSAWAGIQRQAGTEVVHILNPDFPADVALLTGAAGDQCYNIGAGTAGKNIYTGTAWQSLWH